MAPSNAGRSSARVAEQGDRREDHHDGGGDVTQKKGSGPAPRMTRAIGGRCSASPERAPPGPSSSPGAADTQRDHVRLAASGEMSRPAPRSAVPSTMMARAPVGAVIPVAERCPIAVSTSAARATLRRKCSRSPRGGGTQLSHGEVRQAGLRDPTEDEDDRRDGDVVAVVRRAEVADHERDGREAQQEAGSEQRGPDGRPADGRGSRFGPVQHVLAGRATFSLRELAHRRQRPRRRAMSASWRESTATKFAPRKSSSSRA